MSTDDDLLKDTSFDREVAPKNQVGDLLVSLLKKSAFSTTSAKLLSNYPVKMEDLEPLIKQGRIELISQSPIKVFLTPIGKLVALGEYSLREREKQR